MSRWVLDVGVLYGVLDAHRERLGVSWYRVARDLDLSPNVFSRMKAGGVPDSHALGTLLMWLGWAPELACLVRGSELAGCLACTGAPPAGFACLSCGAGMALSEPTGTESLPVRRRNAVTDDHLRSVAVVYRRAMDGGAAPTLAVAMAFEGSHSSAARWVGMARAKGFLGPTVPGRRGGELR